VSRSGGSSLPVGFALLASVVVGLAGCGSGAATPTPSPLDRTATPEASRSQPDSIYNLPLVTDIFTADPSAHVFDGVMYVYTSHDLDHDNPSTSNGDQYDMEDYHVLGFTDGMSAWPEDLGEILNVKDVPWATKQMWAPDAAHKNGTYYLYFPARDKDGLFRIGVATSASAAGPFKAERDFIAGSFSIDPAVFVDDDGQAYMYFGGLWGGQLEKWQSGSYDSNGEEPASGRPALGPRVAKLSTDMLGFEAPSSEVSIVHEGGRPVQSDDRLHRFFEASWVHKHDGTYYLMYSTGESQRLAYATGSNPMGPFVFRGYVLLPVEGWTTHGSIVEFEGTSYLFYADASMSHVDYKRCVKFAPLTYAADGSIETVNP
jgi:beta-xylosidase